MDSWRYAAPSVFGVSEFPVFDAICTPVARCSRCGDDHEQVTFQPMARPVERDDEVIATHWAPCPGNGDPILLSALTDAAAEVLAAHKAGLNA
jgi:hypothetical protein